MYQLYKEDSNENEVSFSFTERYSKLKSKNSICPKRNINEQEELKSQYVKQIKKK